jgi:sugar O-acyltransferase (sialic acid O-acetyltransferase NeuD family)
VNPASLRKVVIFGTGDFAQVAKVYLAADSPHEVVAFTAHDARITDRSLLGLPVVPFERLTDSHPPDDFALYVAVGFRGVNHARQEVYDACKSLGYSLVTYVNSKAVLWGQVEIGDNCFVFESNVIQPFVKIGNNVILWSGNHVGHHSTIGDHCFIASHAVISGGVVIGPHSFVGVNCTIRDHVKVGDHCVLGAGSLILADTEPFGVYKAVPSERSKVPSNRLKSM